jgi:hypothetical protein
MKDSSRDWIAIYDIDGNDVSNGEPDASVFSSKELIANASGCTNKTAKAVRSMWKGATVIK